MGYYIKSKTRTTIELDNLAKYIVPIYEEYHWIIKLIYNVLRSIYKKED